MTKVALHFLAHSTWISMTFMWKGLQPLLDGRDLNPYFLDLTHKTDIRDLIFMFTISTNNLFAIRRRQKFDGQEYLKYLCKYTSGRNFDTTEFAWIVFGPYK